MKLILTLLFSLQVSVKAHGTDHDHGETPDEYEVIQNVPECGCLVNLGKKKDIDLFLGWKVCF